MFTALFLPHQMMMASVQVMQLAWITQLETAQRMMVLGAQSSQRVADTATQMASGASDLAEAVNWEGQEALKAATTPGKSTLPV